MSIKSTAITKYAAAASEMKAVIEQSDELPVRKLAAAERPSVTKSKSSASRG